MDDPSETASGEERGFVPRLRRDLGTIEAYAALVGILVGAGIFRVTSGAFALTGPSVILGYVVLAPAVLASAVAYVVFLSTPLGREPGGEYTHIARTFGGRGVAFVGAWLKLISYLGATAFLASVLADYLLELDGMLGGWLDPVHHRMLLALASLLVFSGVQAVGVRWFGRVQVAMCAVLGVSIAVLVLPGLFAVHLENYRPFFTRGASGFAAALAPLFFAFAGFESLAQTAGEVRDSTHELPRVFLRGIALTTVIFVSISVVAFGVLPGERLVASPAPMADVAAVYLPAAAAALVTIGGVMAVATSLNATLLVPARLALMLSGDGLLPRSLGDVSARTGTPWKGLALSLFIATAMLLSGQMSLALNIAVFALVILYLLHSVALLLLPGRNPALFAQVTARVPLGVQRASALVSILSMGGLIAVQVVQDVRTIFTTTLAQRLRENSLTSLELLLSWSLVGVFLYNLRRR